MVQVAAKVLLYSRKILIDKIAETIGGKDDKSKNLLNAYLDRLDYKDCNIEQCLRSFMQTFRMAGVDSQVVFRILEQFAHKAYANDDKNTFVSKEECYEFTYLIIVL
jgi:Sec7-like guanine-nucleotide exchange factor